MESVGRVIQTAVLWSPGQTFPPGSSRNGSHRRKPGPGEATSEEGRYSKLSALLDFRFSRDGQWIVFP